MAPVRDSANARDLLSSGIAFTLLGADLPHTRAVEVGTIFIDID